MGRPRPAAERFAEKTAPGSNGCVEWTASLNNNGYGTFTADRRTVMAHRWAYEFHVGPIPDGLTIDHLCRNRRCVNPAHLEPVSMRANLLRSAGNAAKTHCPAGHPYSGSYLHVDPKTGDRKCHQCRRDRYYAKKKV